MDTMLNVTLAGAFMGFAGLGAGECPHLSGHYWSNSAVDAGLGGGGADLPS